MTQSDPQRDRSPHLHVLPGGRSVALGKKPAQHDPRTIPLRRLLRAGAPTAPPTWDVTTVVNSWPMYLNDSIGDCTCAGVAHLRQVQSTLMGRPIQPSDNDVLTLYETITALEGQRYDPSTGAGDNGCVELDVLNYLRHNDWASDSIYAYTSIDTKRHDMVQLGASLFGGLYIGISLPNTAQSQVGRVWDVVPNAGSDGDSGSWGGHAVTIAAYDALGLVAITWGTVQRMTWAFWDQYVDESYAILPQGWQNHVPQGSVDWATLDNDLSQLGQLDPTS